MTTIRVAKRRRFTQVDREAINDTFLSFKARGILVWLLDKPDDWMTSADRIVKQGKEGREAVRGALKELETGGYLVRAPARGEDGKWSTEWTVHERPPCTGTRTRHNLGISASPHTGNRRRLTVDGLPYPLIRTETNTDSRAAQKDGTSRIPEPRASCGNCVGGWVEQFDGSVVECKECAA